MLRSERAAILALTGAMLGFSTQAMADVTISSQPTKNVTCSAGVCIPTAKKAILNAGDLETLLASGNVTVTTTGSGVQATDLAISAPVSWSSGSTLAFDAYHSINIDKPIAVAGTGGLSFVINNGSKDGVLLFAGKGNATFAHLSSGLAINGNSYTLVNTLPALASAIQANPSGFYALAASYDAGADGTYSNAPITTTLSGIVEGLGNTVENVSIYYAKGAANLGLFADSNSGSVIENLRLTKLSMKNNKGSGVRAGGLIGANYSTLTGDTVSGSIKVSNCSTVGGLAGISNSTIVSSSANVRLKTKCLTGGLLGLNYGGTISLSHASGVISAASGGGLVGLNGGYILESYATASFSGGNGADVGGLIAENDGAIENSYATGSVTGGQDALVGGFAAENGAQQPLTNSYSTGAVSAASQSVGGFLCTDGNLPASSSYWDITTSGLQNGICGGNESGVVGLTTEQLQSGLPSGFDPTIWAENPKINNGFPYLIANPPEK